jgi:hypothetical protein
MTPTPAVKSTTTANHSAPHARVCGRRSPAIPDPGGPAAVMSSSFPRACRDGLEPHS